MLPQFGKLLIIVGVLFVVVGLIMLVGGRFPFGGKLPGDIIIKKDNLTVYIPIATMILVSILLTVILNLFRR